MRWSVYNRTARASRTLDTRRYLLEYTCMPSATHSEHILWTVPEYTHTDVGNRTVCILGQPRIAGKHTTGYLRIHILLAAAVEVVPA